MKKSFKATSLILLVVSALSLIGCGTDADSGGMSSSAKQTQMK